MAHFAQLDNNNRVLQVVVVNNNELLDENGNESEMKGIAFLTNLLGYSLWKQTSYNKSIRKRFAAINGTFDPIKNEFVDPKPWPSWSLNTETNEWEPPFPKPTDGEYFWDEVNVQWAKK